MKRIATEPLLHFLLLGIAIFIWYGWAGDDVSPDEIVVTRGQQINLVDTFERTWRRPPTPDEFRRLVEDFVREELAYREGARLQLDRNDVVIRRRMRQKLELLTEDVASLTPPTEAELEAYLAANLERFRVDARYSFEHVYVSLDRRAERAVPDAQALLGRIRSDAALDVAGLGDPIALPPRLDDVSASEVAKLFGRQFAEQLDGVSPGEWHGPIASGYGLHLVRVSERVDSRVPQLSEIASVVTTEVLHERRNAAVDALYDGLARSYTISVEPLEPPTSDERRAP